MGRHIVIVNDYGFINGGTGKIAIHTALELSAQGEEVTFFCAVSPICDELKESKVNVVCTEQLDINSKSKIKVLKEGINNRIAKKKFQTLIESFGEDQVIVHLHGWTKALTSSPFSFLSKKSNVKVLLTLHDYFYICPNGGLYNYKKKCICNDIQGGSIKCLFKNCDKRNYFQKLFRFLRFKRQEKDLKYINEIIFISKYSKSVFEKRNKLENKKTFLVPNFVEVNDRPFFFDNNPECLLYIGRVSEEKGVDTFCKLVYETKQKGIVIGNGQELNQLKVKYPDIIFTGWLEKANMEMYIKQSKALIFPSKWPETYGLIVVEMLSYGLPCIVSDSTCGEELIGNNKLVYHTYEQLKELASLSFHELIHYKSKSFDKTQYSMETYIARIKKIYNNYK